MIETRSLTKAYAKRIAVDGIWNADHLQRLQGPGDASPAAESRTGAGCPHIEHRAPAAAGRLGDLPLMAGGCVR